MTPLLLPSLITGQMLPETSVICNGTVSVQVLCPIMLMQVMLLAAGGRPSEAAKPLLNIHSGHTLVSFDPIFYIMYISCSRSSNRMTISPTTPRVLSKCSYVSS